jgi:PAS domain S-box-containing protein
MERDSSVLDPEELHRLLEFIHRSRGFDFSGYKRTSLQRRLSKRMHEVGIETPADYQDYLEVNPQEFAHLFDTILINVTSFFRDRPAWAYLAEEVIPPLVSSGTDPIRVWCAGCATGEEAYTIAIVLAEALGENQFKERVKIYATDADEAALNHARHATYSPQAVKGVPEELLARYFEAGPQDYSLLPDLRRSVIFGRNDLVQDPTISHVDLLVCRNVLMYFTPEAQSHILQRFSFALSDRGFLFLGRSEMLTTHGDLFTPHNLKWRVFQKVPRAQTRERLALGGGAVNPILLGEPGRHLELRGGAFALSPHAQIMVSRDGFVVDVNQRLRELFGCTLADVGRPFQDLALSYRPVDLRTALERAYDTGETVTLGRIPWRVEGVEERVLEVEVRAVPGPDGVPLGASISFMDITVLSRLADEHDERKRELEKAHQRGAPIHQRGDGDHERGASIYERGARDDQRGAPLHQRGTGDPQPPAAGALQRARPGQPVPGGHPREPWRGGRRARPLPTTSRSGTGTPPSFGGFARMRSKGRRSPRLTSGYPWSRWRGPLDVRLARRAGLRALSWMRSTGAGGGSSALFGCFRSLRPVGRSPGFCCLWPTGRILRRLRFCRPLERPDHPILETGPDLGLDFGSRACHSGATLGIHLWTSGVGARS